MWGRHLFSLKATSCFVWFLSLGLDTRKPVLGSQTTKLQTSLGNLISTFVIHYLESIIVSLAPCKISIFWLVSVAEQTGLSISLLEALRTGFVKLRPIYDSTAASLIGQYSAGISKKHCVWSIFVCLMPDPVFAKFCCHSSSNALFRPFLLKN